MVEEPQAATVETPEVVRGTPEEVRTVAVRALVVQGAQEAPVVQAEVAPVGPAEVAQVDRAPQAGSVRIEGGAGPEDQEVRAGLETQETVMVRTNRPATAMMVRMARCFGSW